MYYLALDSNLEETIHAYEPYYNQLHSKWRSTNCVYVSSGMAKNILPTELFNEVSGLIRTKKIVAAVFELENFNSNGKANIKNTIKIF